MKELVSTVRMKYNGKQLRPGERFSARDNDARILKIIGRAEVPTKLNPGDKVKIDGKKHEVAEPVKRKRGRPRKYARRDMTAEQTGVAEMAEHIAGGAMSREQAESWATGRHRCTPSDDD